MNKSSDIQLVLAPSGKHSMCTCALKTRTASRETRHRCFPIVEREVATRRERAAFLQWIRQDVRREEVCRGEWGLARGAAEAGVGAEGQVTARTSAAGSQQRQASWRTRREECLFSLGDLSPPLGAAGLWSDMMHVGDAQPFPFCAKTRAGGAQPPGGGSRPTLGVKGLCPPPTAPSVSTACGESAFVHMFLNSCSEKCHHLILEGRRKEGVVQGRGENRAETDKSGTWAAPVRSGSGQRRRRAVRSRGSCSAVPLMLVTPLRNTSSPHLGMVYLRPWDVT